LNEECDPKFNERNSRDGRSLRPTILLYPTGVYFEPYDPNPAHLDIRCLAHGLAGTNRFNGHTRDLMNVAHHSVIVSLRIEAVENMSMRVASHDIPTGPQPRVKSELDQGFKQTENITKDRSNAPLKGLLHDSPEGVSGFGDVAGPVKHHERIKEAIEWVEGRISDAIAMNYGLPRGFSSEACVKVADTWAYHWENRDLRGIDPPEGIMLPAEKLVPLDRDKARGVFLCRYMELTCKEIGEVPWSLDIDSGRFWLVEMRRVLAALCGGALVSK
jgi:hypothetical protein